MIVQDFKSWLRSITLVEAIIIVAIIGILTSVAIPAMKDYRNREENLVYDGCVIIEEVKGEEKVWRSKHNHQWPIYTTYKCKRGALLRTKTRYSKE